MAAPEQRNVDWASADVEGGTLTVDLTGASSKAWKQRFRTVLALLETPHSRWGGVHLNKTSVQVVDVQQGTEAELRHFLESVVLQANSEVPQPDQAHQQAEEEERGDAKARGDQQMTATFRAFADD